VTGFAGNRIGAIRDAKGRSVASVFTGLESSQKAEVRRDDAHWLMLDSSCAGVQGLGIDGVMLWKFRLVRVSSLGSLPAIHDGGTCRQ